MHTITLHALSEKSPRAINTERITEIIETRFGGCGIVLAGQAHPVHFWETREQVLSMLEAAL
ncbi:MAG TPA: hypothetical protein VIM12_03085 [Noviherbaspirillum sp.]|jgi:hypothetical protein|uniref:hypothetical protein n=1 Tax=Noviherbaspirillum sp. TaxID=1926288 RepID=UPI002F93F24B